MNQTRQQTRVIAVALAALLTLCGVAAAVLAHAVAERGGKVQWVWKG